MQPLPIVGQIVLLGTLLLAGVPGWADPPLPDARRTGPIAPRPPQLALLARHLVSADENQRWEFAAISLNVLLEIYHSELQAASHEKASTPARRAKLARWQRATRNLASQLNAAGIRLAEGASFTVHVDPRQQVLIVVDGQTFSVSGPNPEAEKEIENRIIGEFCAYNDCSFLHTEAEPTRAPEVAASGVWDLHEQRRPAYEIGHSLRCEFNSMSDRQNKARACNEAAVELQQLHAALQHSQAQGYRINWENLAMNPPTGATLTRLVITAGGGYLQVQLPRLASLADTDWEQLIRSLQQDRIDDDRIPVVRQADRLVAKRHAD